MVVGTNVSPTLLPPKNASSITPTTRPLRIYCNTANPSLSTAIRKAGLSVEWPPLDVLRPVSHIPPLILLYMPLPAVTRLPAVRLPSLSTAAVSTPSLLRTIKLSAVATIFRLASSKAVACRLSSAS